MLGDDVKFELEWVSIYTFQCRRMEKFRHDRVLFAGDSAHQVSPFGARGANSGFADTDNLCWKLKMIIAGNAPESLLDTYDTERGLGADENILNSTRSTDFITPKSEISRVFRDAVLDLAEKCDFARPLVNSGRLSVPCTYDNSPLNGPDVAGMPEQTRPGSSAVDAPVGTGWLTDKLGNRFQVLAIETSVPDRFQFDGLDVETIALKKTDKIARRYLGDYPSAIYLLRPDQHVVARWASYDERAIAKALRAATGVPAQ